MIAPLASHAARAILAVARAPIWRSTASATAFAKAASSVNRIDWLVGSCSDWLSRSAALQSESFLQSATTTISLGPAPMSTPTQRSEERRVGAEEFLRRNTV